MPAAVAITLDAAALSRRLGELAGDERGLQVQFLLHLDEFDRRRAYVDGGYASLWEFVTRALHHREGAAYRRITAMKVMRRVPAAADALRSGQICLTTLALLDDILTLENPTDILERTAFKSKRDVEQLVASLRPRTPPKEGLRRLTAAPVPRVADPLPLVAPPVAALSPEPHEVASIEPEPQPAAAPPPPRAAPSSTLEPSSEDTWSLRITVDAELKEDLDTLAALLSHKLPRRELRDVVREAVRCAIEKHGKRKVAVEPERKRKATAREETPTRREPTVEVRRQVWRRDGGRCTWIGPDGKRCDSTWQVEYDHVHSAALGGPATVANGRLLCRPHQQLSADQVFGRAHMERCRRRTRQGESTSPGDGSTAPPASEAFPRDGGVT